MVTVSDEAAAKIRSLIESDGGAAESTQKGLRMAVMGGGCSGFSYKLEFAEGPGDMDQIVESNGVRVFVDPKSSLYLNGVSLIFEDGLMGSGFQVVNPNARTTCGCGESFSV
ncbi:MAG: iron-sulfur cluster assembly accessory protein [Gemmatimonadetes bacterium]|nr:iron-sulfur cluster assembly accessory protein [Gemmatimonadota bacterium]MBT6149048.1 iron-sulfur cluster assembly accessory protein [Gemmatimonadota bacterium]MBT7859706.1 iron-sulfur cluster assembly accessory protein [Gemmatimonadota bacterium]